MWPYAHRETVGYDDDLAINRRRVALEAGETWLRWHDAGIPQDLDHAEVIGMLVSSLAESNVVVPKKTSVAPKEKTSCRRDRGEEDGPELEDLDRAILDVLARGRASQNGVGRDLRSKHFRFSRDGMGPRFTRLEGLGLIARVPSGRGGGRWEITSDGSNRSGPVPEPARLRALP